MAVVTGSRGRLGAVLAAFAEQATATADWLQALPDEAWSHPSALDGWDVRTLAGHLVLVGEGLVTVLRTAEAGTAPDSPPASAAAPLAPDQTVGPASAQAPAQAADFVAGYRGAADRIAQRARETTADVEPRDLIARLRETAANVTANTALDDRTVVHAYGTVPVTALDWGRTRLIELVVHSDDLARSLPDRDPVPLRHPALAEVTRTLTEIFAARAPGHSVELRVPPFAAVQAVDGPRHTRGTPPAVVETDPVSWLRLATGRLAFTDALAGNQVRASGTRADLGRYLPVLG